MNALVPVNAAPAMTVSDVEKVAGAIARGGLFGSKDPYAVLTLCLLAQAEGQHPAVVFRDYHIIQGKPAKKAEAMLRDFINAGGKVEWHKLDDTCADATFSHPSGSARIEWTMDRAKKAGISTAMWSKYPRQMLRSRTISEGVRTVYPGATSGLYVPEEVNGFETTSTGNTPDDGPGNDNVIEVDAERREPAAREKLDGPHTSKTALRTAVHAIIAKVRAAQSPEEVDAIKAEGKRTINQALRDWPILIDGDPNIEEDVGLKGAIELRKAALADGGQFDMLIESMKTCTTVSSLTNWMATNEAIVDELDDIQRRAFEKERDAFEASLLAVAAVNAG